MSPRRCECGALLHRSYLEGFERSAWISTPIIQTSEPASHRGGNDPSPSRSGHSKHTGRSSQHNEGASCPPWSLFRPFTPAPHSQKGKQPTLVRLLWGHPLGGNDQLRG